MVKQNKTLLIPGGLLLLSLALLFLSPMPAHAATFTVNSTADAIDANIGDGICATATGSCTLRAAIQEHNATGAADTINIPAGTYTLTIAGQNEDLAAQGDLDLNGLGSLTITGLGVTPSATVIDGGGIDRVFDVIQTAPVTISNLTVQNGNPGAGAGGGIQTGGAGVNLTLNNMVIANNTAVGEGGGMSIGAGGATVSMNNVAVTHNISLGGGGIVVGATSTLTILNGLINGNNDSGINNSGTVNLTNVTVSANTAPNGAGIDNNKAGSVLNLQNVTINANIAAAAVGNIGGIRNANVVNTRNTIISNNTPVNCGGKAFTSLGNNLDSDATCGLNAAGDANNIDPKLGFLADNGGPFPTHALLAGSPAIDTGATGPTSGCPPTDARGIGRPVDGNIPLDGVATCDKGAFEFRPQKITVTLPPPFDFGDVTNGTTSDHVITLSNAGDGGLIIGAIALADPLALPFTIPVDNCSNATLARAASCTVTLRFAPTAAVASSDSFNIPSNDPAAPTVSFALTGTGTATPVPILSVTDSIAPSNDNRIPFGSVTIGGTSDATVTIANTGTANIVIGTIASANPLADPFSITADGCSGQTIAPAASCTLTVHFAPTANSIFADSFDIPTNEADNPSVAMSVSGTGVSTTGNLPPSVPALVSPADGQTGIGTSMTFVWNKSIDPDGGPVTYHFFNCTDPNFTGCTPVDVASAAPSGIFLAGLGSLGAGIILIGFVSGSGFKRSRMMLLVTFLLLSGTLLAACHKSSGSKAPPATATTADQISTVVKDLTPNTTYHWKVVADDGEGGTASSEVRSYTTAP